ncbi:TonB-dependent receptor plug domain-containing protein [Massilia glaciei]|uniref:TonB-dependent receptor plug domain-containing protein n=1 Tax=Massilia glaciei TaxID=1524097 RepID=UPI001E61B6C4|nr:TonB-dependent receptor plug domain-containing protein [Massilia glaciei]
MQASAQQGGAAASGPSADAPVQTVTVSGFRSSLEKALDSKRASVTTRESIVAEDIGKFPEQNIADAMIRLPGVEVVRDGNSNEGQRIQLRGLGSEYTVTTFNGAPGRATSSGNVGNSTRDFNYDVFASEPFSKVDVYKGPLAGLEEGGIAGVVDLNTPRPFNTATSVVAVQLRA